MARSRAVFIAVSAVVIVVAAAVAAVVVLASRHHHAAAAPPKPGSSSSPPPGQARAVAAALGELATDPASLVASGAQSLVRGRVAQAIPAGSTVSPDVRSWAPDGVGGGTMTVTITSPGKPPVTYAAIMVNEQGAWKVLAT